MMLTQPDWSTASQRLQCKLAVVHPLLKNTALRLWSEEKANRAYPLYLKTMHSVVRSAVPLMEEGFKRASQLASSCRNMKMLADYLEQHKEEERGHDQWIMEDLQATGSPTDDVLSVMPNPAVAELVGAQYYWLFHHSPFSVLGHIAALETYHPPIGFARYLQKQTGYPADAFRTITRHERLDIVHKRDLYRLIDRLDMDGSTEKTITLSALHTMTMAVKVLEGVARATP